MARPREEPAVHFPLPTVCGGGDRGGRSSQEVLRRLLAASRDPDAAAAGGWPVHSPVRPRPEATVTSVVHRPIWRGRATHLGGPSASLPTARSQHRGEQCQRLSERRFPRSRPRRTATAARSSLPTPATRSRSSSSARRRSSSIVGMTPRWSRRPEPPRIPTKGSRTTSRATSTATAMARSASQARTSRHVSERLAGFCPTRAVRESPRETSSRAQSRSSHSSHRWAGRTGTRWTFSGCSST